LVKLRFASTRMKLKKSHETAKQNQVKCEKSYKRIWRGMIKLRDKKITKVKGL